MGDTNEVEKKKLDDLGIFLIYFLSAIESLFVGLLAVDLGLLFFHCLALCIPARLVGRLMHAHMPRSTRACHELFPYPLSFPLYE